MNTPIQYDSIFGKLCGIGFSIFLIKTFLAPGLSWLEIIKTILMGPMAGIDIFMALILLWGYVKNNDDD